jgi:predicted transposase/invertase (TIGR01784 family)
MATSPHDALVKRTLGDPRHAAGELRAVLPPELVDAIDWATLRRQPGSFVDPALGTRHTDVLFSAALQGREALLYVVLEAQRTADPTMPVRLLVYMARIYDDWLRRARGAQTAPPLVVPVVLYHGDRPWNRSTELIDAFELGGELAAAVRPYVPTYRFILDDLCATSDEQLLRRSLTALAAVVLAVLKHGPRSTMLASLRKWLEPLTALSRSAQGLAYLETLAYYIYLVNPSVGREELGGFMQEHVNDNAERAVMTAGEKLIQQGHAEGKREGRAQEAARSVLAVFDARGVAVPDEVRRRIEACTDVSELERWHRAAVVAAKPGDIFTT